ncbi:MAG: hypothetical protein K0R58_771 [Ramlibacter sp.]|jgi:putative hydrolase of the HAD superfamily|nr:hypothetical protein [Ramlibacter sp.]
MDALLLDLDGTLLDDRSAVRVAFAAFLAAHGQPLFDPAAPARWKVLAARHWTRFEQGKITFEDQRRYRVREFFDVAMSDSEADAAFEPYRAAYESAWRLYPESTRFLELTSHLPKVVVTNGDKGQQMRKIQRCGLADHLVAVITPEDCGAWKPNRQMFMSAIEQLGVSAARCMMIGDDRERDIQPAQALGLRTHHVDRDDPASSMLDALEGNLS